MLFRQNHLPTHSSGCTLLVLTGFFLSRESRINVRVRLLILGLFSSGYVLIKGGMFINFLNFFKIFSFTFFFLLVMCKKIKLSVFLRGAMLIQVATFIVFAKCSRGYVYSGATSILDSIVNWLFEIVPQLPTLDKNCSWKLTVKRSKMFEKFHYINDLYNFELKEYKASPPLAFYSNQPQCTVWN